MKLQALAVLKYIDLAEGFEHERLTVLSWSHDGFRRVLKENKLERPYLRAARHAAPRGLAEFLAVIYLHDRDRLRHAHAAAVMIRGDRERFLTLRARRLNGAS